MGINVFDALNAVSPATGDNSRTVVWILLGIAALALVVLLLFGTSRPKK